MLKILDPLLANKSMESYNPRSAAQSGLKGHAELRITEPRTMEDRNAQDEDKVERKKALSSPWVWKSSGQSVW